MIFFGGGVKIALKRFCVFSEKKNGALSQKQKQNDCPPNSSLDPNQIFETSTRIPIETLRDISSSNQELYTSRFKDKLGLSYPFLSSMRKKRK